MISGAKLSDVDARCAAAKNVSKLAFVADRISGGILDRSLAGREWCRIVGGCYGHPDHADRSAFTSLRDAINDLFVDKEENESLKEGGDGDERGAQDEIDKSMSKAADLEATPDGDDSRSKSADNVRWPCIDCEKAVCSGCRWCTDCLSGRGMYWCEGCRLAASVDDSESAGNEDLRSFCRRKTVCPGRRIKCSKLNYTCPDTG